ncbi:MAG: cytochrome c3 family protein [Firmicutes bacterium]|nr:cytochrome c3 family protein [Bacillota bacterium]
MGRRSSTALIAGLIGFSLFFGATGSAVAGISATKHNLSVTGPGTVKATSETQICVFCHTPHNASPATPLWNHAQSAQTYTLYNSTTMASTVGQPDGVSKLCLSCHDGTVAVGAVSTGMIGMAGVDAQGRLLAGSPANFTINLANDHPISFTPGVNPELSTPSSTDAVQYKSGKLQCTSCHNPHDNTNGYFLVKPNSDGTYGSQICLSCHERKVGWPTGIHRNTTDATKLYNGKTVAQNACASCHKVHGAPQAVRLLRGDDATGAFTEEAVCYNCHDGAPASDKKTEFARAYAHPVASTTGVHDAVESYKFGDPKKTARHVECADCHDPHAASNALPPLASGAPGGGLENVNGVGVNYTGAPAWGSPAFVQKSQVTREFELCFKCHSSYNYGSTPPASPSLGQAQTDPAVEFNPANASYHNVGVPGATTRASGKGTYLLGMNSSTILLCSSCHGSNTTVVANSAAPTAVHGSANAFILKAPFSTATGRSTSTDNDLCFKCHDRYTYGGSSNRTTNSGFSNSGEGNLHNLGGMVGSKHRVACVSCHSAIPHGYQRARLLVKHDEPAPYNGGSKLVLYISDSQAATRSGNWRQSDAACWINGRADH